MTTEFIKHINGEPSGNVVEACLPKPYFEEDGIVIYNADCREVLPMLGAVDLVLTDPPYNVGYSYDKCKDAMPEDEYFTWQLEVIKNCEELLKPNSSLFYLHYPEFAARMFWAIPAVCDLSQIEWITWVYNAHTSGSVLRKASRVWLWMGKCNPFINFEALQGEYRNATDKRVTKLIEQGRKPLDYDWWQVEQVKNVSPEKTQHPCQVPIAMVKRLIQASCKKGIVLDPFMGSGTTLVAAKDLGIRAIGIEISEIYCEIAANRLRQGVLNFEAI